MLKSIISATAGRAALALAVLCAATSGLGCAAMDRWCNALFVYAEEKYELADIRRDTRHELSEQLQEERREAAEREVELARYEAERRTMERDFCLHNEEALQERLRSNIRHQLESKVAFKVQQGLEIGELEVDTEKLKELLQQREQPPTEQIQERPKCPCCDSACRCGSGHLRRHCPHCRHCPCELKCGGPEMLQQLEKQPFRQPLRPAEIPMKLPVYLTFGMQQPVLEQARIRQQPITEQLKQPCPYPCTDPTRLPCDAPVESGPPHPKHSAAAPSAWPESQPAAAPRPLTPPVPAADTADEARRIGVPANQRVHVRLLPAQLPAQGIVPAVCVEPVSRSLTR